MTKHSVFVAWNDVPHLSEDAKAGLISTYLPHEREARTKGIPSLGAGAIYPYAEDEYLVEPFRLPAHCRHVYALDVGWNRTAAIWGALDEDTDTLYLYDEYYRANAEPSIHVAAMNARGKWIPGVIDPAARGRSQRDGETLFQDYQNLGLTLTPANNAVNAGIYRVWERLSTGRLKVFKSLQNFMQEMRIYRRNEKGEIVKENDHLMDCMRYLVISGVPIASYRPVEEVRGRLGMGPKHEIDYNPMADSWKVAQQGGR